MIFLGSDADAADDTSVAPRSARKRTLSARVPRTAETGRIAVALRDGTRSPATPQPLTVEAAPAALPAGVIDAEAQGHKVFFGAQRTAELSYVVGGTQPANVQVELVRGTDGVAIASWSPGAVPPGVPQTVEWDGTAAGVVQRDGVYQFRVTATDAAGTRATSAQDPVTEPVEPDAPGAFTFLGYRFPIQGAHEFGDGAAAFGGGRGHQGHDVFAACGTPIVAARGGKVEFKQYHSRAGYYLVIDGARTGTDFVYMHLREAALVGKGDKVKTGQLIGFVGDTGRASGCHLHFEEWTAPGWYCGRQARSTRCPTCRPGTPSPDGLLRLPDAHVTQRARGSLRDLHLHSPRFLDAHHERHAPVRSGARGSDDRVVGPSPRDDAHGLHRLAPQRHPDPDARPPLRGDPGARQSHRAGAGWRAGRALRMRVGRRRGAQDRGRRGRRQRIRRQRRRIARVDRGRRGGRDLRVAERTRPEPDRVEIALEREVAVTDVPAERGAGRRGGVVDPHRHHERVADRTSVEVQPHDPAVERAGHVMPPAVPHVFRPRRRGHHVARPVVDVHRDALCRARV